MSRSQRPSRRPPRPGGATSNGSLYERYKDALRRGHVAALRGRNEEALEAYGEATAIAPDRALPHVSIGGILVRLGRIDEATAAYERAIELAPRDEGALRGLADVHVRSGRRAEAADALDRLAEVLDTAGRLSDATDGARRAFELAASPDRRARVEALAGRLRAASAGDDAAQRALDEALRLLEPAGDATVPAEDGSPAVEPEADQSEELAPPVEPETEQPVAEPAGLGIALGAAAEAALFAGDLATAHDGLLAAARAHRRAGRVAAAVDACYQAIGLAPADPDLHLLLVEVYLDRGWRAEATEKLLLLDRLATLDADQAVRDRLCALVTERLPDEPRLAAVCA